MTDIFSFSHWRQSRLWSPPPLKWHNVVWWMCDNISEKPVASIMLEECYIEDGGSWLLWNVSTQLQTMNSRRQKPEGSTVVVLSLAVKALWTERGGSFIPNTRKPINLLILFDQPWSDLNPFMPRTYSILKIQRHRTVTLKNVHADHLSTCQIMQIHKTPGINQEHRRVNWYNFIYIRKWDQYIIRCIQHLQCQNITATDTR
jgi:hypothetical protein